MKNKSIQRFMTSALSSVLIMLFSITPVFAADANMIQQNLNTIEAANQAEASPLIKIEDRYNEEGTHEQAGYWIATMYGSGDQCWIKWASENNATSLKAQLDVDRNYSMWEPYDTITITGIARKTNEVSARWDDGINYLAGCARGYIYVNGKIVVSMMVDGWW